MSTDINVLHIEDDPIDAILIQEMLSERSQQQPPGSYKVVHVSSMDEALATFKKSNIKFNIIILDLGLQDTKSTNNISILKRHVPHTPILVLTGLDNQKVAINALKNGAQEYIIKGHNDRQLLQFAMKSSMQRQLAEDIGKNDFNYNPITGLMGKKNFQNHIEHNLNWAKSLDKMEFVFFIRINNMATLSQSYSRSIMNNFQISLVMRLKSFFDSEHILAHYNDSTFAVSVSHKSEKSIEYCQNIAKDIYKNMKEPVYIEEKQELIESSISIAATIYPTYAQSFEDITRILEGTLSNMRFGGSRYRLGDSQYLDKSQNKLAASY